MPLVNLIKEHQRQTDTPVLFAARYRNRAKDAVYLLEVCKGVSNPADASWDTFEMPAPHELGFPSDARLKITYISPEEFFDAQRMMDSIGHRILDEIKREGCDIIYQNMKNKLAHKIKDVIHGPTAGKA
ncbi:MAG: hypothetical protein NTX50_07145 [Candidatus Sumerlaeota bacterium]|nr:hypothetical protein [Candidatus Sumerlaeota bacterium]